MLFAPRTYLAFAVTLGLAIPAFSQTPVVNKGGTVNGATFSGTEPIAPGALISIFGTGFYDNNSFAAADSVPLSTNLKGVSATINNVAAPMVFVNPTQINAQVPWEAMPEGTSGTVNVVVTRNGKASAPQTVNVGPFSPGVFQFAGHALVIIVTNPNDPRYGLVAAPPGSIPNLTTARAKKDDLIFFYATGLGAVTPSVQTGHDSQDHLRQTNVKPQVLIGGLQAELQFSGLSPQFPGVYQVNAKVPAVPPSDTVPIQLLLGGITTPPDVTMAVGQ